MVSDFDKRVFIEHAEVCKVLANHVRLMILYILSQKEEASVSEIAKELDISMANASQHLARLRSKGLVEVRKEGQSSFYRVADARIPQACFLIRSSLMDRLKKEAELAERATNI